MKLNGVKLSGPNVELIVIPRGDGPPIVFKAQAVLDMEEFSKLCPDPKPPQRMMKGGRLESNFEDPNYLAAVNNLGKMRLAYMIIKGLQATDGLEWETVKLENPTTWLNYDKELRQAGFSEYEIGRIRAGITTANCLNDDKIEEAKQRFLASQVAVNGDMLSPTGDPKTSSPGEPVSASV